MKRIDKLTPKTKVADILDAYPFMPEFLVELSPKYKLLTNPVARKTVGAVATLAQAASIGGIGIDELLSKMADKIEAETGTAVSWSAGEAETERLEDPLARHEVLKEIIRDLHAGADMQSVKARFRDLIRDIDAAEISKLEQRLIEEGMPAEEVKRLCDVHVQVFRESLEEKDVPAVAAGHPVHTYMLENRAAEKLMDRLEALCDAIGDDPDREEFIIHRGELEQLLASLLKIDLHYQRKEYQLFPLLEKHGVSGPSQVMWSLHDDIRGMLRNAGGELRDGRPRQLVAAVREIVRAIRDMIYKEERILFPASLETLSAEEWETAGRGEAEIGYAWIEPEVTAPREEAGARAMAGGAIGLDTGKMTAEQIDLLLKSLPIDISFVDENDEVAYYSAAAERIFPRSPGIIGRKVQNCHPPGSVQAVQRILDDFRAGKRDVAVFWIQMQGRFIHIRYFAMRAADGAYRGCVEVSQDVTEIRRIQGEKRLLD